MRACTFMLLVLAMGTPALPALSAGRACDQSESIVIASPQGQRAASVQHQVCETDAGRAAAAVTVFVGAANTPMQGARVVAIAVPRSREEWPRVVWRSESLLEVWVPNFAQVLESRALQDGVSIALKYCGDDPAARQRVQQHQVDLQQWMAAMSRWAETRKLDPEGAGERPKRPAEPRVTNRACRDADIPSS
jgi:hypothetical protein